MSIWSRIGEAITSLIARGEQLSSFFLGPKTPPERSVAFTIAVVGLGAKMAKADGQVKTSEVAAFRRVFRISASEEAAAARVFNLARQDIAGFDVYAGRIASMFRDRPRILEDILEGLFHIAMADGHYHENEEGFLRRVAEIFGISEAAFSAIEARQLTGPDSDPWQVLGVSRDAELPEIRKHWRDLIRENHPDVMIARGLPSESITLATARITAINRAWDEIKARNEAA